jgi:hypothetical protein
LVVASSILLCGEADASTVTVGTSPGQFVVAPISRDLRAQRSEGGVRLQVNPPIASPETQERFRLQNRTDMVIKFGAFFEVQAYSSAGWLPAVFTPVGLWPTYSALLLGHHTGGWQDFVVPADIPAGLYRVRKPITIAGTRQRSITAPFEVGQPYGP